MQREMLWSSASILSFTLAFNLVVSTASAQVIVQQPVFSQFVLGTTVSVPTGGGALLGGISRAGEGRTSFGPFRPGTATGMYRDAQSVTTHVTVHDFEAMDRMLLEQARGAAAPRATQLSGFAAHAYDQLTGTRSVRRRSTASEPRQERPAEASGSRIAENERLERAARALRLGEEAWRRNRPIQARLHFQMAAREGSTDALKRLAELDRTPVHTATSNP